MLQPGDLVGSKFRVILRTGAGAMGAVYQARAEPSGDLVAIKVLAGGSTDRFEREADVLQTLEGPGIVRFVSRGRLPTGAAYLVMEWIPGEDLAARLARGRLSVSETIALGLRLAGALAVAHERGVVHRDLKPSNVRLPEGSCDDAKLVDFGVARLARAGSLTHGGLVGTVGYAAPEQVRGDADVDGRADLFGLGAVLHECLTGDPPFQAEHAFAVLAKLLLGDVPDARSVRPEVPAPLAALLAQLLAKDRAARPDSARSVVARLRGIAGHVEPGALPETLAAAPPSLGRSEKNLLGVVLLDSGGIRLAPESLELGATLDANSAAAPGLVVAARRVGASFEVLPSGSVVASLSADQGAAGDLAARAARFALLLAAQLPGARIAVAVGRSETRKAGEAIDRAAACLARAAPGEIAVDDTTAGLLGEGFAVDRTGMGPRIAGERDTEENARLVLGKAVPCVGRERELATLLGLADECFGEESSRAALVTGAAGAGKTRLRQELVRALGDRPERPAVWIGRADLAGSSAPFALLASALRAPLGLRGANDPRAALASAVARVVPARDRERIEEVLAELFGLGSPTSSDAVRAARSSPELKNDQLRRAIEDFTAASLAIRPVALLLEDVHHADPPSLEVVRELLRSSESSPLLVVAFARPEVSGSQPGLRLFLKGDELAERGVTHIELGPLGRKAVGRLVRAVLPDASAELEERIASRAAGNPFFLEELLRAVAAGKGELPGAVSAVVQARLETLEPELRRALRAASVLGNVFWAGGVAKLLGLERADAEGRLRTLAQRELVLPAKTSRLAGETELSFRHAIVREVAYGMLTDDDRALGHRIAAEWLEDAGEADAGVLAQHWHAGGDDDNAAPLALRAAEQALEAQDLARARELAERGLGWGADGFLRGELRAVLADVCTWSGQVDEGRLHATLALSELQKGGERWCAAHRHLAMISWQQGRMDELEGAAKALIEAGEGAPGEIRVQALAAVARWLRLGRKPGAREAFEVLSGWITRHGPFSPATEARLDHSFAFDALLSGDVGEYAAKIRRAVDGYERIGDARNACLVRGGNLGFALCELGHYDDAERELRLALETAERLRLLPIVAASLQNLGLALGRLGRFDEGIEAAGRSAATFERIGNPRMAIGSRMYEARVRTWRGDPAPSTLEALAEGAEKLVPDLVPYGLGVWAEALLAAGDAARALEVARRAVDHLVEDLEEGEALVRVVHTKALVAAGATTLARQAAALAAERVRRKAARITDPASRESYLRVPENAETLELSTRLGSG